MTANKPTPVLADFTRLLEGLKPRQEELEKHKAVLRDQEHKFVAERSIQDATQMAKASCDAANSISDCRRFSMKGTWCGFSMKGTWCVPGGRPHTELERSVEHRR